MSLGVLRFLGFVFFGIFIVFMFSTSDVVGESNVGKAIKKDFKEFKVDMNEKLKKLDADIEKLQAKMGDRTTKSKDQVKDEIADLKAKSKKLKGQLENMGDKISDDFDMASEDIKNQYEKLEGKLSRAWNELKK